MLLRRRVRLYAQQISQDPALFRRKHVLVPLRIQYRLPLVERNRTQLLESLLHQRCAVRWQLTQLHGRAVDLHLLLRRQPFQHLIARQPALALRGRHAIHLPQLLHQPLLVAARQRPEAGISAQHPLLLLYGKPAMLVEPLLQAPSPSPAGIEGGLAWLVPGTRVRISAAFALIRRPGRRPVFGPLACSWIPLCSAPGSGA